MDSKFENTVYIADSRNMHELPDASVDLIVTSPPYFNIKNYALDGRQEASHSRQQKKQIGNISDFQNFIDELLIVWAECSRVLKPNGKLSINTPLMPMLKSQFSTHENRHIFDINASIQISILNNLKDIYLMDTYIWNRTNPSKKLMFGSYPHPTNFYAQNTIEFVSIYVKSGSRKMPNAATKAASRLTQDEWVEFTKQVWDLPVPNKGDLGFGAHAALMPEAIVERCVRLYSFEGDVVLDPFVGSGTTLRVAQRWKRKYVGYEIMKAYKKVIKKKVTGVKFVERKADKNALPKVLATRPLPEALRDHLFYGNYEKLVPKIPSNSIDLVCVDPPYNLKKAPWDTFDNDLAFFTFTFDWVEAITPKIKPGGSLYVFNTPRNAAHILVNLEKSGFEVRNWITWHKKDGFVATKRKFLPESETIIYAVKKGDKPYFDAEAVRVPYISTTRIAAAKTKGILKNGKRWYPNRSGRLCADVWEIPSDRHSKKLKGRIQTANHPTIKPLALIERIVLASSRPGDVVADIFAGTGTTLVAAQKHGRIFLGAEREKEFFNIAQQRLADKGE